MNKKKLSVLFTIGILLTVAVVASIDISQTADAVKSKGVKTQKYGQATKNKVCGDRLCSESTSKSSESRMDKDHMKSMDKDKMKSMGKMDMEEMKKQHMDMISKMKTMNKQEMIGTMKQMMTEQMNMIEEWMQTMDREDIIDHMSMMTDQMGEKQMKYGDMKQVHKKATAPLYNEDLNPSQIEYQNIVGFNDLHIEAIRHLEPNGDDSKLDIIVHHHCKVYDDMTGACLLFPTGMNDQDKPYGIEYIITSDQFHELSDDEKKYWHYHLTELPRAQANFPDLTDEQLLPLQPVLDETYGKVFYFWDTDDKYPIGEPSVLVIQNLPE